MKRTNSFFLAGLILLIAGAASLVYGLITYNNATGSLPSVFGKLFNVRTDAENQAIMWMIIGAAGAVVGLVLLLFMGRARRR